MSATMTRPVGRFRDVDAERAEARLQVPVRAGTCELAWPEMPAIRLCAVGLRAGERAFLDRMVAVSQHRAPRLSLLPRAQAHEADVIMIDGADDAALEWSYAQDWLAGRAVIWVNKEAQHPGHTQLHRPIQWPMLQLLLASSIRRAPSRPDNLCTRAVQPDAPMVMVMAGEARLRHQMRVLLDAAGYRVTLAGTAREGLAAMHAGSYACLLLAGEVPDLDSLEARVGRIPILKLDEQPGGVGRLRSRLAGCDDVLPRPQRVKDLEHLLGTRIKAFAAQRRAQLEAERARPPG
jgi:CheY-like chemotaxis protein